MSACAVLTAGHCVYDTGEDVLYAVSTYNITVGQDSKSAGNGIRSTVAEAAGHPQYTTADEIGLYDVGILKLSTAVPSSYQPVKLNYSAAAQLFCQSAFGACLPTRYAHPRTVFP